MATHHTEADLQRWITCEKEAHQRIDSLPPTQREKLQKRLIIPLWYLEARSLYDKGWGEG